MINTERRLDDLSKFEKILSESDLRYKIWLDGQFAKRICGYLQDYLCIRRTCENPTPIEKWSEDDGDVLWWKFPIEEPPYCGSPLDSDWPGYHTHFTKIVCPKVMP